MSLKSGVVAVEPHESGVDRMLRVQVRDLDAWIVEKVQAHRIVSDEHFSPQDFRVWLTMFRQVQPKKDWGVWWSEKWQELQKTSEGLKARKEKLGAAGADPDYEYDYAVWEEQIGALRAYTNLRNQVRHSLYLILDNSRLLHLRPKYVMPRGMVGADGRTIDEFEFHIRMDPQDEAEWGKLIRGAQRRLQVQIGLGVDLGSAQYTISRPTNQPANDTDAKFPFVTYGYGSLAAGLGLVIAAFGAFLWLAVKTDLLRDPDLPRRPDNRRQFSLARCQTAFWFFLFVSGYVFLAAVNGATNTLTDQCLVLLGISTGTMLGATVISRSFRPEVITNCKRVYSNRVQRFFYEVLSDGERLTFYRFQMMVWTFVLGMVFVKSVWTYLQMPTFGTNELALMGISAGSYLAFKFPESKARAENEP